MWLQYFIIPNALNMWSTVVVIVICVALLTCRHNNVMAQITIIIDDVADSAPLLNSSGGTNMGQQTAGTAGIK